MNVPKKSHVRFALCCLALISTAIFCSVARATPYATGLTNSAGTVSFILNEAADEVKIISGGTTNLLGARPAGLVTQNVGAANPFYVEVSKSSGPGYAATVTNVPGGVSIAGKIQISTDPILSRFPTPRGLAINRNAASPFFGRIYVANATAGTTATRPVGRGLYTMNADFSDSSNGYGNTAQTGGLTFAVSANSPYRLSVGQDDHLYISDFSDANGNVYRTDGDLKNGQWVLDIVGGSSPLPVGRNHGSTLKAIAEGSLEGGNLTLYTIDEDLGQTTTTPQNDLWRYDIGSGPLTNQTAPTVISSVLLNVSHTPDFCKGGSNNYLYLVQNRSVAANPSTASPSIFVVDQNGTTVADSLALSRELSGDPEGDNLLVNIHSVAISPDGNFLAANLLASGNSDTYIIPLTNGIPDLANVKILDTGTVTQGRGVDFDAAGNIYTVSSGDAAVRAFSPGGFTIATTGSDGTFNLFVPNTTVTVTANDDLAKESGDTAELSFARTGNTSGPLTVSYTLTGTATNGSDYSLPGTITFAAGDVTTNLTLAAQNDVDVESTETIVLTLVGSAGYTVGSPGAVTISIADNETPELSLVAISPSMYERIATDYSTFQLTRKGDTNNLIAANIAYSGTASAGRYTSSSTVDIEAGIVTKTFTVSPLDDVVVNGNQTIVATIGNGGGVYNSGVTNSATTTIIDDDYPAETAIFSDPLTTDTSLNWKINFGANNLVNDYEAIFGYDFSGEFVSPAPNGLSTGLKLTVNKVDATTNGAAGINLYPNGQNFSGDFALRFNMYITQNGSVGGSPAVGTTEYALFGINHSGNKTNWVRQSGSNTFNNLPRDSDGLWFSVISDGSSSAPGDFTLLTGTNAANAASILTTASATNLTQVFKKPPYSPAAAGAPANIYLSPTNAWADVEVKKIGSLVTMSINRTPILEYTNTTAFTAGNIMLGYMDPYESIGASGGAVYFSNLRVVQLAVTQPNISKIQLINGGTQVQIDFVGGAGDTTGSFKLQNSATVNTGYADDNAAIISSPGAGTFRFITSVSGATQFYRIHHL